MKARRRSCTDSPGGAHGYDPQLESLGATFIASGPAFRSGLVVEPFENIHLYALMAEILGLDPVPTDGDLEEVRHFLAASAGRAKGSEASLRSTAGQD